MKASVIIPTLNSNKTLDSCLESLVKQDIGKQNFEIIIVDGGSTDGSIDTIKKYTDLNKNIKFFVEEKCGISEARNIGAEQSRSDILIFIDSDCVVQKNYIQNVIDSMKSNDIVAGETISLESKKVFERSVNLMNDVLQNRILFKKVDTSGKFLNVAETNNLAVKKSVFMEINGFDWGMGKNSVLLEDQEFLFRALKITNNFAYNKRNKVIHRRRDSIRSFIKQYYSRGLGWSYSTIKHRGRYIGKFYIFLSLFYFILSALLVSSFFNIRFLEFFLYIFLLHLISLVILQILVLNVIKRGVFGNLAPWLVLSFTLFIRFLSTAIGVYVGMVRFFNKSDF